MSRRCSKAAQRAHILSPAATPTEGVSLEISTNPIPSLRNARTASAETTNLRSGRAVPDECRTNRDQALALSLADTWMTTFMDHSPLLTVRRRWIASAVHADHGRRTGRSCQRRSCSSSRLRRDTFSGHLLALILAVTLRRICLRSESSVNAVCCVCCLDLDRLDTYFRPLRKRFGVVQHNNAVFYSATADHFQCLHKVGISEVYWDRQSIQITPAKGISISGNNAEV